MTNEQTDLRLSYRSTTESFSRRRVLRATATAGVVGIGSLATSGSVIAQQGGAAYLKKRHLQGQNNPDPRFKIVKHCWTREVSLPCDGAGAKTYAAYQIRCPNYSGGGGNHNGHSEENHNGHSEDHDEGDHGQCPGGGCGRHVLINPNRRVKTGLDQLYEFVTYRECGEGPGDDTYVKGVIKPV